MFPEGASPVLDPGLPMVLGSPIFPTEALPPPGWGASVTLHRALKVPSASGPLHGVSSNALGDPGGLVDTFQRWQRFKKLIWSRLPQRQDRAALSCFLLPILRSLASQTPTLTLEDGLRRGEQEWGLTGPSERVAFHEMATRFMELEAQEEMQKLTWKKGVGPHIGLQAQTVSIEPHGAQHPGSLQASAEVLEDIDNEGRCLWASHSSQTGETELVEDRPVLDQGVLSLIDQLCSQEDVLSQAEAHLHPHFLEEILSPDPELDLDVLAEKLGPLEGLSPIQLTEQHPLDVDRRGFNQETSAAVQALVNTDPSGVTSSQDPATIRASGGPAAEPNQDEGPLPSLAFLLASPHSLLPPGFALSPEPTSAHSSHRSGRHKGPRCAPLRSRHLLAAPAQETKSRKHHLKEAPGQTGCSALHRVSAGLADPSPPKRRCPYLPGWGSRTLLCSH